MKLKEYITEHHNGNQRQFALANDMKPPQVTQMLSNGRYHVIDGYLFIQKRKLKEK